MTNTTTTTLPEYRLINHRLAGNKFETPAAATAWLGAVQAQDYAHSKWTVGARCVECTDAGVEQAVQNREIVRTWALRGTLHLLAAADVRWILALIAPGIASRLSNYYKKFDLDENSFPKIREAITGILQGGRQLTREALFAELEQRGIATHSLRGTHILYRVAIERILCLGAQEGKQPTYTLLDEWIPDFPLKTREEALAEFALRYFSSHGPATIQDFSNWSGLNQTDCKTGLEAIKSGLVSLSANGQTYWMPEPVLPPGDAPSAAHLLAGFDEYLLGYKDRTPILDTERHAEVISFNGIFKPTILINGRVAGIWSRTFKKDKVLIETTPFIPWSAADQEAIQAKANEYAAFMGKTSLELQ